MCCMETRFGAGTLDGELQSGPARSPSYKKVIGVYKLVANGLGTIE